MYYSFMLGFIIGIPLGILIGIFIYFKLNRKIIAGISEKMQNEFRMNFNKMVVEQNNNLINAGSIAFKNVLESEKSETEKNILKISSIIDPLGESIKNYHSYIESIEKSREGETGALNENIDNLYKKINSLEVDTNKLVNALKNPSIRGKWGEITLKRVVEMAGMSNYCTYNEQVSSNDNTYRPDMIIQMPAGKKVIVDSKVPLNGYFEYLNSGNESDKKSNLSKYLNIFSNHIRDLSSKKYYENFDASTDFVIMFLPLESLLSVVMENSPDIIEDAISKKVIVSTPITLISLLLTIHMGWRDANTIDSIRDILLRIKDFSKSLTSFIDNYNETVKNLNKTIDSFNKTTNSFERKIEPIVDELGENEIINRDNIELNHINKDANLISK